MSKDYKANALLLLTALMEKHGDDFIQSFRLTLSPTRGMWVGGIVIQLVDKNGNTYDVGECSNHKGSKTFHVADGDSLEVEIPRRLFKVI